MIKTLKRIGLILLGVILVAIIAIVMLFGNELRSLASIKKIDDYGQSSLLYLNTIVSSDGSIG